MRVLSVKERPHCLLICLQRLLHRTIGRKRVPPAKFNWYLFLFGDR
jgi:hypothetical protein